jgi:ABC-type uncharacterized transport system fused permease/ATPase subunit
MVSIGHRTTLMAFHSRRIEMTPREAGPATLGEVAAGE